MGCPQSPGASRTPPAAAPACAIVAAGGGGILAVCDAVILPGVRGPVAGSGRPAPAPAIRFGLCRDEAAAGLRRRLLARAGVIPLPDDPAFYSDLIAAQ